jgi:MoaA/NifB/PqqE/SkfB family radical SAM enzyme
MLVDDDTADWLAAADATFQVSVDAADPSRHNDIRRSPHAFDRALAGVSRLVARGVEVSFAYTATPENLTELAAVVALAADHGVRRVCVGEVLPEFGNALTRDRLRLDAPPFASFVGGLHALREQYRGKVDVAVALLSGHVYDARLRASPCTALERDMAILHDGWAYPCPFVRKRQHRLGNVLQQSINDIWASPAAARFRAEKSTRATKHCVDSGPIPISITTRRPIVTVL